MIATGLKGLGDGWNPVGTPVAPYDPKSYIPGNYHEPTVKPYVSVAANAPQSCKDNPMARECDSYTGLTHFQYALPGGVPVNADITTVSPIANANGSLNVIARSDSTGIPKVVTTPQTLNPTSGVITSPQSGAGGNVSTLNNQPTNQGNPVTSITDWLSQWFGGVFSSTNHPQKANDGSNTASQNSVNAVANPMIGQGYTNDSQTWAPEANGIFGWLEKTVPIGNFDVPLWILALGGGAGLYFFSKYNSAPSSGRYVRNPVL